MEEQHIDIHNPAPYGGVDLAHAIVLWNAHLAFSILPSFVPLLVSMSVTF